MGCGFINVWDDLCTFIGETGATSAPVHASSAYSSGGCGIICYDYCAFLPVFVGQGFEIT